MRVLVLGGCGFIGSHVVDHLLAAGHEVRVVSRRPEIWRGPLPGVSYHYIDFRERALLANALSGCDAVMHLISATTPGSGDANPGADVRDNLVPTLVLLDLMQEAGVPKLVYFSSGGMVYGDPEVLPIPESHPLRPTSSYAIVKVAVESYIALFCRTRGLAAVILRPSNSYGERQGPGGGLGLVNTLLRSAVQGGAVRILGDGTLIRDFLHVHDLARLSVRALESGVTGVFNAGTGVGVSVNELIGLVTDMSGQALDLTYGPARTVDVAANVLDISRARTTYAWEPQIALREGLAMTLAWHRSLQAGTG